MPKRSVVGALEFENTDTGLAGWQTAGLTLAVIATIAFEGLGALAGVALLAPVLIALIRLRRNAPTARSTADLVGAVLGARATAFTGILQILGYTLLAVMSVPAAGLGFLYLSPNTFETPDALINSWWLPLVSVIVVAVAGLLAYSLSTRVLATIVAVVALTGLLIEFYFALAIIAKVLSGTEPIMVGEQAPPVGLGLAGLLVLVALSVVGFEVSTIRNRQIRSFAWPVGMAAAAALSCSVAVWFADYLGTTSGFHWDTPQFTIIAYQFFGSIGDLAVAGALAIRSAAVLGLIWAAVAVIRRLSRSATAATVATTAVVLLAAAIGIALCRNWVGINDRIGHCGALLILVVYVLIAEANSRLSTDDVAAWWIRIYLPAVLAAAVLLPLLYFNFADFVLWPVGIAAIMVLVAAAVARQTDSPGPPAPTAAAPLASDTAQGQPEAP